jgi:geranylgeranyl diphosphate synthase, type II
MSSPASRRLFRPERLLAVIHELAFASGSRRLVGGQFLDISNENQAVDTETVECIMANKTTALIRASLTCGARLGGGSDQEIEILEKYGDNLGFAFQVRDDLLDIDGDCSRLGKAVQKDQQRGKATFPMLLGKERAREMMQDHIQKALSVVRPLGQKTEILVQLAVFIGERVN